MWNLVFWTRVSLRCIFILVSQLWHERRLPGVRLHLGVSGKGKMPSLTLLSLSLIIKWRLMLSPTHRLARLSVDPKASGETGSCVQRRTLPLPLFSGAESQTYFIFYLLLIKVPLKPFRSLVWCRAKTLWHRNKISVRLGVFATTRLSLKHPWNKNCGERVQKQCLSCLF